MKTKEIREWSNLIFLQNYFFLGYIRRINAFTIYCMVIPLGPHSVYTSQGAQRFFKLNFQEIGPWKLDHEVGRWKKAIFHDPWCKPAHSRYVQDAIENLITN